MIRLRGTDKLLLNLLLAAMLIAAQVGVAMHALEHETAAPQAKVCSICLTTTQLGAATVDVSIDDELEPAAPGPAVAAPLSFHSLHVPAARQRGPPAPLRFS